MNQSVTKTNWFTNLFPKTKHDWKMYIMKSIPIIIGEILFCLNGFLDNFMVSHLDQGIDALTYANTWTGLIYIIFFAIQGIAAMYVGQYYGRKMYHKVNQIMNIRFWMNVVFTLFFALPVWISPTSMIKAVSGQGISTIALDQARLYLILISFSWLITCYNFNTNMQLNETGHSNYAFVGACLTLVSNATINATLLYGFHLPAWGAAVGSICAALVCLLSDSLFTYFKDRPIFMNPLKIFMIKKDIAKQVLIKVPAMLINILAMATVPMRMIFWARAYPENSVGEAWMHISGATILGLVESLAAIASAVIGVCSSNVSYFVATKLGQEKYDEAQRISQELKGFHTICGIFISVIMIGVVYAIGYLPVTSKGVALKIQEELTTNGVAKEIISQKVDLAVSTFRSIFIKCCWTFIGFNALWCWFYTSLALIRSGGKSNLASIALLIGQGTMAGWHAIICFVIVPHYPDVMTLQISYFLLFSYDFIRWIMYETIQMKCNWKRNITLHNEEDQFLKEEQEIKLNN
ncbi:MATE family efflux transporter [[Mycoplasma] anseris]|uniref:Probable multidrug resistance protein NorM n=1 Tax=[Mycoplasma] anseris TaxID=92400 RepID=A0A2Z4NDB9_9BACT|nr:MATE family efflux transporter [[Mycoplasma] anseris]AWX69582.1 MATE family efflux transporter [[Mycoplasma] anseris]